MKIQNLIFVALLFFVTSCSQKNETGEGVIRLNLTADASTVSQQTKVGEPTLTPEDFKVRFEDYNGTILSTWSKFTDVPSPTKINAGSYRVVAWYGSPSLPAWDVPYYEGAADFTIAKDEAKSVAITATLAATKMQVKFDDSFKVQYSSYSVDILTENVSQFLNFSPLEHGKAAYYKPGKQTLRFRLTSKASGETILYSPTTDINTLARESYTFNLSAKANNLIVTIVTDETTNDKPIEIIIPRE